MGIVLGDSPEDAKDALMLRAKLGKPLRQFYKYSIEAGLAPVAEAEIIKQSGIHYGPGYSQLDERLKIMNAAFAIPALTISPPTIESETFKYENYGPFTMDAITRTVSFKLTGNQNIDERVYDAMANLTKHLPWCEDDKELLIRNFVVERNKSELSLTFRVVDDTARKPVFNNIFLKTLFTQLENIILHQEEIAKISIEEERLRQKLIENLNVTMLQVKCIPKAAAAVRQYEFMHPEAKDVKCVAYYKNKKPIIEFQLPNGARFECKTKLLKQIALKYFTAQIAQANAQIKSGEVSLLLKQNGIFNLELNLIKKGKKNYVAIELDLQAGKDIEEAKEFLAKFLNLKATKKIKTIEKDSDVTTVVSDEKYAPKAGCVFRVPDIENLSVSIPLDSKLTHESVARHSQAHFSKDKNAVLNAENTEQSAVPLGKDKMSRNLSGSS